ncbi:glycosyltransferase family 4 protein [Ligilactobacillus salivarius]|uniref:glycosyltransferase family 4 protein n=1 Tax=Ligilactobacillus salivarius TaxID=1624 RepID=UPI0022E7BBB4|nr:glycosyltransferase family 4 protein [Ligilactobacillus salivarius]
MINIAIQNSTHDMTSGASHSLISMAKEIKKEGKYNPIIILPESGELEKKLNENDIECYVINDYRKDMWSTGLDTLQSYHAIKIYTKLVLSPIRVRNYMKEIKNILINKNIKLVHINMLTCGLVGQVAIKMGIPVVWHIREYLEEDIGAKILWPRKRLRIINQSKRLIAISEGVKSKFQKILTPPIDVIYNGIDFSPNEIMQHEILTNDVVKVAIFGRISEKKGQFELAQAMEKLYDKKNLDYELLIYGGIQEFNYFEKIQEFVKLHGAENRIYYKGMTSHSIEVMKKIDILGICSNQEAFGRVTVEGQIAGCLVIGANSGGTKELINDGVTGYKYVTHNIDNLSNVIWDAIQNREMSNKIATAGQSYAIEHFSARKNAEEIMNLYDELLA